MPRIALQGKVVIYLPHSRWHGLPDLNPPYSQLEMNCKWLEPTDTDLAYIRLALALLKRVDEVKLTQLHIYQLRMEKVSIQRYLTRVGRLLRELKEAYPECVPLFINYTPTKHMSYGIYQAASTTIRRVHL